MRNEPLSAEQHHEIEKMFNKYLPQVKKYFAIDF